MATRFGEKALQMGHLQDDGSMKIPVDCIVEAAQSLGSQRLNQTVETLKSEEVVSMLESAETFVERVSEARRRKLRQLVDEFQSEPEDAAAHQIWKDIEKTVFGVDFHD